MTENERVDLSPMVTSDGNGILKDIRVVVGDEAVMRRLHMSADVRRQSGELKELFRTTVERSRHLITPAAISKTLELSGCAPSAVRFLGTEFQILSRAVSALLDGCGSASMMAATIGPELSSAMDGLMGEKKMTEAMIMDAFGSEAVEEVVNSLCRTLRESAAIRGFVPTRRFSPGYGDWDLSAQREVLDELGAARIGISLSASSILIPEKSVTAIMGWRRKL